jgi:hypothetical protein
VAALVAEIVAPSQFPALVLPTLAVAAAAVAGKIIKTPLVAALVLSSSAISIKDKDWEDARYNQWNHRHCWR